MNFLFFANSFSFPPNQKVKTRRKRKNLLKCVHSKSQSRLKREKSKKKRKNQRKEKEKYNIHVYLWFNNIIIYIYGLRPYYIIIFLFYFFETGPTNPAGLAWNKPAIVRPRPYNTCLSGNVQKNHEKSWKKGEI